MSMTRNDSLSQIARSTSRSIAGLTAGEILSRPVSKGLDERDREFFARHGAEPANVVAIACSNGRVWPGDDSRAARKLRHAVRRAETAPAEPVSGPTAQQVRAAREAAGLSQTAAAGLVYSTLRTWQNWEAGATAMHPAIWEMWQIKAASTK